MPLVLISQLAGEVKVFKNTSIVLEGMVHPSQNYNDASHISLVYNS